MSLPNAHGFTRLLSRLLPQSQKLARVAIPADVATIYAIGDVHGHLGALKRLETAIAGDMGEGAPHTLIVMLGDYVDRGPDSAGVLSHLTRSPGPARRLCLRGNHEALFAAFLDQPTESHDWLHVGGRQTLISYGLDVDHLLETHRGQPERLREALRAAVPEAHRAFLHSLPGAAFTHELIFAHAGIYPGVPLESQSDHDLLWIREPFLSRGPELDRIVVHGHTVQSALRLKRGRLGIDMGVQGSGRLTAVRLSADGIFSLSA